MSTIDPPVDSYADVPGSSPSTSVVPGDDYTTVMMLAVGLLRIRQACTDPRTGELIEDPAIGLLPDAWRVAMARLWWRCWEQGVQPPASDLDAFGWCRLPFGEWNVRLRLSPIDMDASLIDTDGELSEFTEQASRLMRFDDVEGELMENQIHAELRVTASMNADGDDDAAQASYTTLRRLLIDNTVLTDHEVLKLARRLRAAGPTGQPYVTSWVDIAYVRHEGGGTIRLYQCGQCKNIVTGESSRCGTPGCDGRTVAFEIKPRSCYYTLHRSARRYMHDPGLVEARVHDALTRTFDGKLVKLTQYPGMDALDLLVEFYQDTPDGRVLVETWGADAKDQKSPRLLGRGFKWPTDFAYCQRRFLVLPTHRCRRAGYVGELESELSGRGTDVEVVDERRFRTMVVARAKELTRR